VLEGTTTGPQERIGIDHVFNHLKRRQELKSLPEVYPTRQIRLNVLPRIIDLERAGPVIDTRTDDAIPRLHKANRLTLVATHVQPSGSAWD
jgi:hypothetical protein